MKDRKEWSLTDIYVRDKADGRMHRVGDDQHDSLWVDSSGTVHFHNLQNGDGCGADSITDPGAGYEFCPSDDGTVDEDYLKWRNCRWNKEEEP